MLDGQDQETVAVSGTHLGGVVAQKRTKVKNRNASEKVTADVFARRILDYGIVKAEKATNLVWHYFRKFCPKKLAAKRPAIDPLRLQDHALCMLCMESKDQERREHVKVKLGKCKSPTATAPTKQFLGCTKLAKMMAPSGSVAHKVAVDATRIAEEVSPTKMSI
jgi:hypothetical protein